MLGLSDISIGEVNVAFSNEDSSTDIRINSAQFLKGEKQDEDEEGSLISQDMMSFSWQIAQGMVSVLSNYFIEIVRSLEIERHLSITPLTVTFAPSLAYFNTPSSLLL